MGPVGVEKRPKIFGDLVEGLGEINCSIPMVSHKGKQLWKHCCSHNFGRLGCK